MKTTRAISAYAQYACLLSLQLGSIHKARLTLALKCFGLSQVLPPGDYRTDSLETETFREIRPPLLTLCLNTVKNKNK
jgi:hypothetical protein